MEMVVVVRHHMATPRVPMSAEGETAAQPHSRIIRQTDGTKELAGREAMYRLAKTPSPAAVTRAAMKKEAMELREVAVVGVRVACMGGFCICACLAASSLLMVISIYRGPTAVMVEKAETRRGTHGEAKVQVAQAVVAAPGETGEC